MYKFPIKLKISSFILMILGIIFTVISFNSAPKTLEEAKSIMAAQDNHGGHGSSHNNSKSDHTKKVDDKHSVNHSSKKKHSSKEVHKVNDSHDSPVKSKEVKDSLTKDKNGSHDSNEHTTIASVKDKSHKTTDKHREISKEAHKVTDSHGKEVKDSLTNDKNGSHDSNEHTTITSDKDKSHKKTEEHHSAASHDDHHAEHVFHQLQNRPVAAFFVAMLFLLGISLLAMAFYAGQRIAQAGWSVMLFRVFEAISNNIHYVSIVMLFFIIGTALHYFHLFPWMKEGVLDPQHVNYDPIIYGKKWWMTIPRWTIRSVIYLTIWNVLRFIIRKMSIKQDNGDLKLHKRLFNMSVAFVATFLVTESMMSWDWIMGIDPHWFSTLFGWYVLSTFLVCALTVTALVTIYLRYVGALPKVNDSHIHDLAKFMFGFSVFWTYLWFCQFMLVWYADMPEETTYYLQRFNDYKELFLGMIVLNFIFPVLVLLNSDFKSLPWFIIIAGVIILVGHYIDLYVMIMPGTVGDQYGFGFGEIGGILFFIGMFIYATFSSFAKANPYPKGSPFLHESETFHYYNIKHRGESNDHH